ncbi:MAG TPA: RibD family protein [Polyangiaceae bacterium]|jgi:riboflavin-specific deaminase-like protein|nr:RibD family protein [Polyangiaceae bacterium]
MIHLAARTSLLPDEVWAWGLIRALGRRACAGEAVQQRTGFDWDGDGRLEEVASERAELVIDPASEPCFQTALRLAPSVRQLFELYLPLCVGPQAGQLVIGHVGQSLDGQIATKGGASRYVTGPENIVHMHRLRALFDAVVVGASTVEADDPELTTRLVPGEHPTRVVLDPSLRLPHARKLYKDGAAPTLIACERGRATRGGPARIPLLEIAAENSLLSLSELLAALTARGLRRVFVEGGGVTISHFIQARLLDRLHVAVCPIIIGRGRPGISLPGVERLDQALRPAARRFTLGEDVLFDCRLSG